MNNFVSGPRAVTDCQDSDLGSYKAMASSGPMSTFLPPVRKSPDTRVLTLVFMLLTLLVTWIVTAK